MNDTLQDGKAMTHMTRPIAPVTNALACQSQRLSNSSLVL
jgi:hypothetical protein